MVSGPKGLLKRLMRLQSISFVIRSLLRPLASWLPDALLVRVPVSGRVCVRVPAGGSIRLETDGRDTVSSQVYWKGIAGYEPATFTCFVELARRADTFVDVGAHVGIYSLVAARMNPSLAVHSFEANPGIFSRLARNIELNGFSNVTAHQVALMDSNESVDLYVPRSDLLPAESSVLAKFRPGSTPTRVQGMTLDAFTQSSGLHVDLMKIDVEGAEHLVLRGAYRILREHRPIIICELLYGEPAGVRVPNVLNGFRYTYFHLTSGGVRAVPKLLPDRSWKELNFLLVPDERCEELPGGWKHTV